MILRRMEGALDSISIISMFGISIAGIMIVSMFGISMSGIMIVIPRFRCW